MADRMDNDDTRFFPILKGESVGESGEYTGSVVIIMNIDELSREWQSDDIAVLHEDLDDYLKENPKMLQSLFENCSAVLAEFGDSIGEFSLIAHHQEAIAVAKVIDATYVLEEGMHVRIVAHENEGNVYFID